MLGRAAKEIVCAAWFTTWLNGVALLAVKMLPAAGVYTAEMLWVPAVNVLLLNAAVPPLNVTAEPAETPSTPNWIVPTGGAVPLAAATVAVMVTG